MAADTHCASRRIRATPPVEDFVDSRCCCVDRHSRLRKTGKGRGQQEENAAKQR